MEPQAAAAADIASGQQRLRNNDSLTTLTSLPDAIHIMIIKFIAIEEELSKLIRVSKQFSNIICHKNDNNNNNKFQITTYKKEFHVPVLTISPKIENCVGNKIRKRFDKEYYKGKITSYDHHTGFYKVKYIDGDEEEMDEDDIEQYRLPKKHKIWHGHRFVASSEKTINKLRSIMDNDVNSSTLDYCTHMIVKDIDMFEFLGLNYRNYFNLGEIISLNISAPQPIIGVEEKVLELFFRIAPNLKELDVSNINMDKSTVGRIFAHSFPHLEKLTWNGYDDFNLMDCGHLLGLKELYMDDSTYSRIKYHIASVSNLQVNFRVDEEGNEDRGWRIQNFLFKNCCENLERVSIRNFKAVIREDVDEYENTYFDIENNEYHPMSPLPQAALIKFVRNAPSLCWFRSHLTQENMDLLKRERPGIELLN